MSSETGIGGMKTLQPRNGLIRARTLRLLAAFCCAAGSLASWLQYFTLYWPYRNKFDRAGRYFDETTLVVHHEQSGMLVIPALALSVLALGLVFFRRPRRQECASQPP